MEETRFWGGGEISIKGENFLGRMNKSRGWNRVKLESRTTSTGARWVEEGERERIFFEEESGKGPNLCLRVFGLPYQGGRVYIQHLYNKYKALVGAILSGFGASVSFLLSVRPSLD